MTRNSITLLTNLVRTPAHRGTYLKHPSLFVIITISLVLTTWVRALSQPADEDRVLDPKSGEEATPASLQLGQASDTEVSERESKLKNIEDELLKKLSLGGTSPAQETEVGALPDVRHVPSKAMPRKQVIAEQPKEEPKPQKQPNAPSQPKIARSEEFAIEPHARAPRSTSTVPVSSTRAEMTSPPRPRETYTARSSSKDLERKLAISDSQITLLSRELENAKNRLSVSEARVAELSRQLTQAEPINQNDSAVGRSRLASTLEVTGNRTAPSFADGMTTARLTTPTQLRTGPSSRDSSIMRLEAHSLVGIERRDGSWYRVLTLHGTRGWVTGRTLLFNEGNFAGSTVRVGAYRQELEASENSF